MGLVTGLYIYPAGGGGTPAFHVNGDYLYPYSGNTGTAVFRIDGEFLYPCSGNIGTPAFRIIGDYVYPWGGPNSSTAAYRIHR